MSLIVDAVVAGAAAGTQGVASAAVRDAYAGLLRLLRRRSPDGSPGAALLEEPVVGSPGWRTAMAHWLNQMGLDRDLEAVAAARRVMAIIDPTIGTGGPYQLDMPHARGVQIGDGNVQYNRF